MKSKDFAKKGNVSFEVQCLDYFTDGRFSLSRNICTIALTDKSQTKPFASVETP